MKEKVQKQWPAVSESGWPTEERGCPRGLSPGYQALEGVAPDILEDLPRGRVAL